MMKIISDMILCVLFIIILLRLFCRADPVSGYPGSSLSPSARSGEKTQNVPLGQLCILLYVVLTPLSLTRRTGPEKTALFIPSPWYTSGKLLIDRKSDLAETVVR